MKKLITAFKHLKFTWSNNIKMKELRQGIEKSLIKAGFSDVTKTKPSLNSDEKESDPIGRYYSLGKFDGMLISIELTFNSSDNSLDIGIDALKVSFDKFFLHAIREKVKSRVSGSKNIKYLLLCEYKLSPTTDEEII